MTDSTNDTAAPGAQQPDLFAANIVEWPVKDDLASMEFPLFSLSKRADTQVREYTQESTGKRVRITPPVIGAATVFDKDLLLFIGSQLVEAHKAKRPISRQVKFDAYSFFLGTGREPGGKAYENINDMLRRLRGTVIETNITTGGVEQTRGFGWIEDFEITRKTKSGKGVLEAKVTLAEWLYNAFLHFEVLTISKQYFLLGQALERRFYELARKHAGDKPFWVCDINIIRKKSGSVQDLRRFRSAVRDMIKRDALPDYRLALDTSTDPHRIVFYTRDNKVLLEALKRAKGGIEWYEQLERQNSV